MPLAVAVELVHTATLVHDDIIDQDDIRRGKPTLYKKWSVNDAILTGDALIALAIDLASGYGKTILKTVAQSALELCEGEHLDMLSSLKSTTEESYFERIRKKSASLFRAAAYCGALVGSGAPSALHSLSVFGENFGITFQLRDDLFDLTSPGAFTPNDLKIVRLTLPLIHLYEISNLKNREQLEQYLQILFTRKQGSSRVAISNLHRMLVDTGSIAYCKRKMVEYTQKAIDSIQSLKKNAYSSYFVQMVKSLVI